MNIPENILSTLTDEQKKKVEAAQTPEELLALAKETGYELSSEQLDSIAGGSTDWCKKNCHHCSYCRVDGDCNEYCAPYQGCWADCGRKQL